MAVPHSLHVLPELIANRYKRKPAQTLQLEAWRRFLNLPYRRIPFGRTPDNPKAQTRSQAGGLEIRDTAGWKPALPSRALARHPRASAAHYRDQVADLFLHLGLGRNRLSNLLPQQGPEALT